MGRQRRSKWWDDHHFVNSRREIGENVEKPNNKLRKWEKKTIEEERKMQQAIKEKEVQV